MLLLAQNLLMAPHAPLTRLYLMILQLLCSLLTAKFFPYCSKSFIFVEKLPLVGLWLVYRLVATPGQKPASHLYSVEKVLHNIKHDCSQDVGGDAGGVGGQLLETGATGIADTVTDLSRQ